jgi:long-chain acyl-CoA synthetase
VPGLLAARAAATPGDVAFMTLGAGPKWRAITWSVLHATVQTLAAALEARGLAKGERVAILAPTSVEWEYLQLASLSLGAVVAGIDPNYAADPLQDVLRTVEPEVLVVHDEAHAARVPADVAARVRMTVLIAPAGQPSGPGHWSLAGLLQAAGAGTAARTALPSPSDDAIIVFSSGAGGQPKPVAYTHGQILLAVDAILGAFGDIDERTVLLCWLPLANLFQRVIDFCAIARGATSYVISDPRDVMRYVGTASPTLLIGVPRVFERIQRAIAARIEALPALARRLTEWGIGVGRGHAAAAREGRPSRGLDRLRFALADRLVLRRVRAAFGARLRYFVSGSAPMPIWLLEWFGAIGLPVYEAYGVSENIVPIAINRPGASKPGTVGRPLAVHEVRVAPDGHVLVRGAGVFSGYWRDRSASDTRFSADGFWATGDCGSIDADGFLTLTGRTSDLFKTGGGRWVAPAHVEAQLRRLPYVDHAVVTGAGRPAVAAILALDREAFARRVGTTSAAGGEALSEAAIAALRADLVGLAELAIHERPSCVVVALTPFTIEGGELTSNLKLRRRFAEAKYGPALDRAYRRLTNSRRLRGAPRETLEQPLVEPA